MARKGWLDFQKIKAEADFTVILERYGLAMKKEGKELVGTCPFHSGDTQPSFKVNVHKTPQVFHCFGCGAKGNVLDVW